MKKLLLSLLLIHCSLLISPIEAQNLTPLTKTHVETGDIEGIAEGTLAIYKAIPYAAPPVGDLRWRAPQPAKACKLRRVRVPPMLPIWHSPPSAASLTTRVAHHAS